MGQRPIAEVDHRYEWTYLYGFVHPTTGDTEWLILPQANGNWFNQVLKIFAQQVGAVEHKQILLVLDGAGWHSCKNLVVPQGIHLQVLPPYSPELQPAEQLWRLADEPIVNRCFDTLDDLEDVLEQRCRTLLTMQSRLNTLNSS